MQIEKCTTIMSFKQQTNRVVIDYHGERVRFSEKAGEELDTSKIEKPLYYKMTTNNRICQACIYKMESTEVEVVNAIINKAEEF